MHTTNCLITPRVKYAISFFPCLQPSSQRMLVQQSATMDGEIHSGITDQHVATKCGIHGCKIFIGKNIRNPDTSGSPRAEREYQHAEKSTDFFHISKINQLIRFTRLQHIWSESPDIANQCISGAMQVITYRPLAYPLCDSPSNKRIVSIQSEMLLR